MRTFLAINPPEDVRRRVWDATEALRAAHGGVAWTAEVKIHLTLKFLGSIPESSLDALARRMMEVARTHAPPLMHLQTIGAFPNFRRPRVVWLGVDPEPRLELLHHDIEIACAELGHELDGRPFRPHLTLGRLREPGTPDAIRILRMAARQVRFTDDFHAQSIDVMQSIPGPGGSTYRVMTSAPMRGA